MFPEEQREGHRNATVLAPIERSDGRIRSETERQTAMSMPEKAMSGTASCNAEIRSLRDAEIEGVSGGTSDFIRTVAAVIVQYVEGFRTERDG